MNWLVLTFVVTFTASAALAVVVRVVACRLGVVDRPDGKRKLHGRPVARWGGIAVYLALGAGLLTAGLGPYGANASYRDLATVLAAAAGIVCIFGALDDCWCLGAKLKLLLQVAAVLPMVAFGFWIKNLTLLGYCIDLGWLGVPLTVLWLLGCINSLNLLDGMDGLASTVGVLAAVMIGVIATGLGHGHVAAIAVVLAAALAGFLVHNLPPARIFLGDSGSMVIGLVLGVLALQSAMKTPTTLAIALPAVIMSLPMFDTLLAVVRRKLTGRALACADREHIHHRLLDRGLSSWQSLCILGAFCLTTGGAAAISAWLHNEALAWIATAGMIGVAIRWRLFGNQELALVARGLARLLFRAGAWLDGRIKSDGLASDPDRIEAIWSQLIDRVKVWKAERVEMVLKGPEGLLCRCGWTAPQSAGAGSEVWSLVASASDHAGHCCEIGAGARGDAEDLTNLAHELAEFAVRLAGKWDAGTTLRLSAGSESLRAVPQQQSKAA